MSECEHGTPGGAWGGCPPCQGAGVATVDFVVYARGVAAYPARCPLGCDAPIGPGDPIGLVGEAHDLAEWAHLRCAEDAAG